MKCLLFFSFMLQGTPITKTFERKLETMSLQGFKSLRPDLFPDEEKRKCSIVRYCAAFLSIGNHSLKRKRTRSGLPFTLLWSSEKSSHISSPNNNPKPNSDCYRCNTG